MENLLFYIEQIEKKINEFAYIRYRNRIEITEFLVEEDNEKEINPLPPIYKNANLLKKGDFWAGRDKYLWLHKNFKLPENMLGEDLVGYFDFGKTGHGNNSSFESMIYVNGNEYQGVDSNHKEVFFDSEKTGSDLRLDFRLWSGLEGGGPKKIQYHQFKEAFIAVLDKASDDLYYYGKNIIETIRLLDMDNPYRYRLEKILIETMKKIDYTNFGTDEFYKTVENADVFLNEKINEIDKNELLEVVCIGHTHIDLAWLWRIKHTREKAARSFSTVMRLMDRYDEYCFLQTQAQMYDYLKEDFPKLYEEIKQKVKEGKWEPSGSMWVESDCNLTSGESIVRQILYGKMFFENEFNYSNTFLWLPDVFGYSWAMPQILKKSGIDTFITTKISWNETNRMPNDTFIWRGIDGSEVLTHFITTPTSSSAKKYYTYNGVLEPYSIKGIWNNYRNKDLNESLLISYGYGDGGGGVNRDMLENRRRINKLPGMPYTPTGKVTNYLKKLHDNINNEENTGRLEVWDGELYLEYHRGTYTSQAYNKKMNRKLELAYRDVEILSVYSWLLSNDPSKYPKEALNNGWKIILRNQFHDIIPGSSINEVYIDSKKDYELAQAIVDEIRNNTFKVHDSEEKKISIFNTAAWNRDEIISLNEEIDLYDKNNNRVQKQISENKSYYLIENIESMQIEKYKIKKAVGNIIEDKEECFIIKDNYVESKYYKLSWNSQGQVVQIYDKSLDLNILTDNGNEFQIFEDKPRQYDAWELEATIDDKKEIINDFKGANLISKGQLFIKIRFKWTYNKSEIIQDMILYNHSKRIEFDTQVDWREREKILKVAFPVDVRATKARYDIQYGSAERPTHRSTSWDAAKFEVVGHQWANIEEKGLGVALLNDSKYGYDIKDNIIRLTLLKSSNYPDTEADLGIHNFKYAIYVHEKSWNDSNLVQEAWSLNSSLIIIEGQVEAASFFDIDARGIGLDAIKKAEVGDRIIMRFHEYQGGKNLAKIKLKFKFKKWYFVDLMEKKISDEFSNNENIEYKFKPFELVTIAIDL